MGNNKENMTVKYLCQKCKTKFSEDKNEKFIKSVVPACPICKSNEIVKVDN